MCPSTIILCDQRSSRETKHNSFLSNFLYIATTVSCFYKLLTGSWLDFVEHEVFRSLFWDEK